MLKKGQQALGFLTQVRNELKKVKWPTQKEIKKLTLIVVGTIVILSLYISALDITLTKIIEWGIKL